MIDFSKITEAVGSWIAGSNVGEIIQEGPVSEVLEQAGLDPVNFEGLSGEELTTQLQELATSGELMPEISQALEQLGADADVTSLIETLKGNGGSGS